MGKKVEKKKVEVEATPGENSIRFRQTSKGIWVCDGLCIYCKDVFGGLKTAEKVIPEINDMLRRANEVQKESIQKKIQV